MSDSNRRLCIDYLMAIVGTRGSAKHHYGILSTDGRRSLLVEAKAWDARHRIPQGIISSPSAPPLVDQPVKASKPLAASKPVSLQPSPASPQKVPRQKKTMFSILLPPADLESLRGLADETGETVAYHVREAIRRYLRASKRDQL